MSESVPSYVPDEASDVSREDATPQPVNANSEERIIKLSKIAEKVKDSRQYEGYVSEAEYCLITSPESGVIKKYTEGQPLIDLGCGPHEDGGTWRVVERLQPSSYIGVDKYRIEKSKSIEGYDGHARQLDEARELYARLITKMKTSDASREVVLDRYNEMLASGEADPLPIELVSADMLTFLAQQPDNSANIMINGIDAAIIPRDKNPEYHEQLYRELDRVAGKNHIVFGSASHIFVHNRPTTRFGKGGGLLEVWYPKENTSAADSSA